MATDYSIARRAREGNAVFVAAALQEARRRTLSLLDAYVAQLGATPTVPCSTELNPPCWEAGHVAWFCDFWIARNPQRGLGPHCDPGCLRPAGRVPDADALYDSSTVAHATRWKLSLLDLPAARLYLAESLDETLALLLQAPETSDGLYLFRLSLFHEDMHAEAGTYMAQTLGLALPPHLRPCERRLPAAIDLRVPRTSWRVGHDGPGFAFDNEMRSHEVELESFAIDSVAVSWRRFLPAVEAGAVATPRYLRRGESGWQALRFGRWETLELDAAAVHLSWHEAAAWCQWAGRRLPSEAEWECAAFGASDFAWGDVWEWTASRFAPFDGFVPGPYRDYSRIGFAEHRQVLKGASRATDPRMAHPKYRNFFTPDRSDIHSGFRSCPL